MPKRLNARSWPPAAKAVVIVGLLALAGALGAPLISGLFAKRDSRPVPVEQLITVLNGRAERILREMDAEDAHAIASLQSGKRVISQAGYLSRSRATRALFVDLQKQHIAALRRGDLVAAHEILAEIQEVLAHRAGAIFDAKARVGMYAIDPNYYEAYSRRYPGGMAPRDSTALSKLDSLAWSTQRLAYDSARATRVWEKIDSASRH